MRRRGFTFIELLVIVTIVCVTFALLAPAVHRATQDARKTKCTNNLKLIALAMHNYHDAQLIFPPGWIAKEGHAGNGPGYGWGTMISPYMDQVPLYNKLDFKGMPAEPNDVLRTSIPEYLCPADSTPETNPLRGGFATSNYTGNYGDKPFPRWLPAGQSDAWPGGMDAPMKSTGLFARNSSIRIAAITDGSSNTFLVGERCRIGGAAIWPGTTDNSHEDDVLSNTSHGARPNSAMSGFSSMHARVVAIAMCDGSVRTISIDVESKPAPEKGLWQILGNKADRMVVRGF